MAYSQMLTGIVNLKPAPPTIIGQAYEGGYYAGPISRNGTHIVTDYLIAAPKATGQSVLAWGPVTSAGAWSLVDGYTNTDILASLGYPAASFCKNLTIGGYTDWYLPAFYELQILYYYAHPGIANNATGYGYTYYNVPPQPYYTPYTASVPNAGPPPFYSGGSQAFNTVNYWSSSEDTAALAKVITFYNGVEGSYSKTNPTYTRAIRQVPA